jgi:hypothetical protein
MDHPKQSAQHLDQSRGCGQLARGPPGTTDDLPSLEGIKPPLFFVFMILVYLGLPPLVCFPLSFDPLFSTCHP